MEKFANKMGIVMSLLKVKKAVFLAFCVLFTVVAARAGTITLKTSPKDITTIQTSDVAVIRDQTGDVTFQVEGNLCQGQTGEPDIPWQVVTVLLPPNADVSKVSVYLNNPEYKAIDGDYKIEPVPPMGTWDEDGNPIIEWPTDRKIEDGYDVAIYKADAFWPQEARINHAGGMHQWQLAEVAVPLVRYNSVSGQLEELVSGDVVVDTGRKSRKVAPGLLKQLNKRSLKAGRFGRSRVRGLAANFQTAASEYDSIDSSGEIASAGDDTMAPADEDSNGYVIITTDAIVNSSTQLANFVAHKQALGWNVTVATESQWGGGIGTAGATNIRNWLRANYISMDILYVLLIGNPDPDTGDVPMHLYDDGKEDGDVPTDNLYSTSLNFSSPLWDKYWEVVVGRIPFYANTTIPVLDSILTKTINYENSQQVLWRHTGLLPMVPSDDSTPGYQLGEQIRNNLLAPDGISSTRIYDEDYGVSPEYLRSERTGATEWASQPYGLIVWWTHGNVTSASGVMSTGDVPALDDTHPGATYQCSCQNSWPEKTYNLAFKILQNGGINTVGGTRNTYYSVGQTSFTSTSKGSNASLGYRYVRCMTYTGPQSCGLALSNAKQEISIWKVNAIRFVTYGDPSVTVFVDPDTTPPTPDPMTWDTEPYESGPGQITMTAATAVDNGDTTVQYYFECVSGGGHDSGWQSSPVYIDTHVAQLDNTYRVKARDNSDYQNETDWSPTSPPVSISPYPYTGVPQTIPGRIQAEYFDGGGQGITYNDTTVGNSGGQLRLFEDVDIAKVTDETADDYVIDGIQDGEWLIYSVDSTASQTDLYARVASVTAGGQILVKLNGSLLATINVPNTGSLTTWQSIYVPSVSFPGLTNASLKLEFVGTGFRLNWIRFGRQEPYLGSPFAVPGRIELEDYDLGGMQISFYDKTNTNNYGAYRPDEPVDILSAVDEDVSQFCVYAEQDEWLEYTSNIVPGYYTITLRNASFFATSQQVTLYEGDRQAAVFTIPSTGSWYTFQDTTVSGVYLTGGEEQVLRFGLDTSSVVLNRADFVFEPDDQQPYSGTPSAVPGRIEFEDYDLGRMYNSFYDTTSTNSYGAYRPDEPVDILSAVDEDVSQFCVYAEQDEWLEYTSDIVPGYYTITVRNASFFATPQQVTLYEGDRQVAVFAISSTGSWYTFQDTTVSEVYLTGGDGQVLRFSLDTSAVVLNKADFVLEPSGQQPYLGTPSAVPGSIEFEDYDLGRMYISFYDTTSTNSYGAYRPDEPVDILSVTDEGIPGFGVYAEQDEWLKYTCDILPGYYTITLRNSSYYGSTQQITLYEGDRQAAVFSIPSTGSWYVFQDTTVSDVYLAGGDSQVLQFSLDTSAVVINKAAFVHYNLADITRNGRVDMEDFALLASQWLGGPGSPSADVVPANGGDGNVDMLDLQQLAENWLFTE